jgi:predicted DNA-binding transcriptional regulator AlpA
MSRKPMARRLLRLPEVLFRTGDSRSGFYRKIADGTVSPGVPLNPPDGRAVGWPDDEIDAHVEATIAAARGPRKRSVGRPRKAAPPREGADSIEHAAPAKAPAMGRKETAATVSAPRPGDEVR